METTVHIVHDAEALAMEGAGLLLRIAQESVRSDRRFAVAISGGSTPRGMHRLLTREPILSEMPWAETHMFWVDERLLPYDHPESNYGAARDDFLSLVPIPEANVNPMPVHLDPGAGAATYRQRLGEFFNHPSVPVFDLIFLGLGPDGHTASLFPERFPNLSGRDHWVIAVSGGSPSVERLTLNYNVLNSARHVVMVVSGAEKADVVRRIVTREPPMLPAHYIEPSSGSMTWLLDRAAGAELPEGVGHGIG